MSIRVILYPSVLALLDTSPAGEEGREARGEEEQHRADMRGLGDKMEEVKTRVAGLRTEQRRIEDELEAAEYLYR